MIQIPIENRNYDIIIQLSSITSFSNLLVTKSSVSNIYFNRP